jgi:hypothetical protein
VLAKCCLLPFFVINSAGEMSTHLPSHVVCNEQVATSIIFFFPYVYPVTQDNMNWTVVVVAATVVIAGINWILFARHTFKGPKRVDMPSDPSASDPSAQGQGQEAWVGSQNGLSPVIGLSV